MTGPGQQTQLSATKRAIALERRLKAHEMRKAGKSLRQIAAELGISLGQAHADVSYVIKQMTETERRQIAEWRNLELERLDDIWQGVYPFARSGIPASVDQAIKLMERRAKLLGLDMPTKLTQTNADGTKSADAPVVFLSNIPGLQPEDIREAMARVAAIPVRTEDYDTDDSRIRSAGPES